MEITQQLLVRSNRNKITSAEAQNFSPTLVRTVQKNLSKWPTAKAFESHFCKPDAPIQRQHYGPLITGDYPTMLEINAAYGNCEASRIVYAFLTNFAIYCGGKDMLTDSQRKQCANIIVETYPWLKITEIIIFFHRLKAGHYGHFYGNQDPIFITEALKVFLDYRKAIYDKEKTERLNEKDRKETHDPNNMTREEYNEIRDIERMYEMPTRWNNYLRDD